jgi:methylated-DNA-[protein]-cysteine S-methyltransferase
MTQSSKPVYNAVIDSPIGRIGIVCQDDFLTEIDLQTKARLKQPDTALSAEVARQLEEYFSGGRNEFSLPVLAQGTEYQKRVWQQIAMIPAGKTKAYSDVAQRLKTGARAVGNACRNNPVPLVIPCHRVVAKHGLGGFAGEVAGMTLEIKKQLLAHELEML